MAAEITTGTTLIIAISSVSQEICSILQNPKNTYSVHKSTALVPILSQCHPIHDLPGYFFEIHFNNCFYSRESKEGF
jgi:hypothetical protein